MFLNKNKDVKKKIIIPGGSGFIGKYVANFFLQKGFEVVVLTRSLPSASNKIQYLYWDGETLGDWITSFENATLILNLAGKSVDCRYNSENKKKILNSRIHSTKIIGAAIQKCLNPPKIWMNMSTATIYEHTQKGKANDEINGIIGDDFSMGVAKAWEAAFESFDIHYTRKIALRTSIVLGKEGGALHHLKPLVQWGLGGKNGSGKQFVSWIHEEDLARMIYWLLENPASKGPYNCASPTPISNANFMKNIRNAMGVPIGLPATKWMIEIGCFFMRTESELVLKSRKVVPKKILEEGFQFKYDKIEAALNHLLST